MRPKSDVGHGPAPILEASGLRKAYRQGRRSTEVLKGVDLSAAPGEITAIVGPSGSGKSTLLHILGGLDRPTSGQVLYRGKNLSQLSDREQSRIRNERFGFVFQFYHLLPELTAVENVMLPRRVGGKSPRAMRVQAISLLERVGLAERAPHLPSELSGGEQQRVAIARALVNNPELVFCDEPTGNLDSASGEGILELLMEFNRERRTTFLIVTHEPAVTKAAGRVLSLKDGQLWR